MRRIKLIALFLCAGTIALFALWPSAISLGRDNQFIKNWIQSDRLEYRGYLAYSIPGDGDWKRGSVPKGKMRGI